MATVLGAALAAAGRTTFVVASSGTGLVSKTEKIPLPSRRDQVNSNREASTRKTPSPLATCLLRPLSSSPVLLCRHRPGDAAVHQQLGMAVGRSPPLPKGRRLHRGRRGGRRDRLTCLFTRRKAKRRRVAPASANGDAPVGPSTALRQRKEEGRKGELHPLPAPQAEGRKRGEGANKENA